MKNHTEPEHELKGGVTSPTTQNERDVTSGSFNLSEKIWKIDDLAGYHIPVQDVKEFIKLLKEAFLHDADNYHWDWKLFEDNINKLAGVKLI